jgi:hypothetical protein
MPVDHTHPSVITFADETGWFLSGDDRCNGLLRILDDIYLGNTGLHDMGYPSRVIQGVLEAVTPRTLFLGKWLREKVGETYVSGPSRRVVVPGVQPMPSRVIGERGVCAGQLVHGVSGFSKIE